MCFVEILEEEMCIMYRSGTCRGRSTTVGRAMIAQKSFGTGGRNKKDRGASSNSNNDNDNDNNNPNRYNNNNNNNNINCLDSRPKKGQRSTVLLAEGLSLLLLLLLLLLLVFIG